MRHLRLGEPDQKRIQLDRVARDTELRACERRGPRAAKRIEHWKLRQGPREHQLPDHMERIRGRETQPAVTARPQIAPKGEASAGTGGLGLGRYFSHQPYSMSFKPLGFSTSFKQRTSVFFLFV